MKRTPFWKAGLFLVERLRLDRPGKGNRVLHQELISLSSGKRTAVREYYAEKAGQLLLVLFAGLLAAGICFLVYSGADWRLETQTLERPGYGEGDRNEELTVQAAGSDRQSLEITVQERKYTEEEKDRLLEQAAAELENCLAGENESLDEVRHHLVFPLTFAEGAVQADWVTVPYGIIEDDGTITRAEDEAGVLVEIQASLTCGGKEALHTAFARVYPPVMNEEEKLRKSIQDAVQSADDHDRYKETVTLPSEADGKQLTWGTENDNPAKTVAALTILAVLCLYAGKDQKVHQRAEERREQLALDYPDVMWKMAMLIGAGLTIRGAFSRIAGQYRKKGGKVRYVYEEIGAACFEMESGVPEAEAYERFGRRCQLPQYIRLGSYLSQNLKKGSRGLKEFLEQEAVSSLEERKNHARRLGEQAGTKLLIPMVLMLGVVLVILMVPAFLSF